MESVNIVFQYTRSWYTLYWSIVTKNVKPCHTAPLGVLTFCHQKTLFQEVGRVVGRLLTSNPLLSSSHFSHVHYISLLGHSFCLSALTEILEQA